MVWKASFKPPIWRVGGVRVEKEEGGFRAYKNNNGNYSLGLVPIHRSQPRLLMMSDYCYSDRLLLQVLDPFLQPLAIWSYLLKYYLPAFLSPA